MPELNTGSAQNFPLNSEAQDLADAVIIYLLMEAERLNVPGQRAYPTITADRFGDIESIELSRLRDRELSESEAALVERFGRLAGGEHSLSKPLDLKYTGGAIQALKRFFYQSEDSAPAP